MWGVERVDVKRAPTLVHLRQALETLPRPREGRTQIFANYVCVYEITDTQVSQAWPRSGA